MTALPCWRTWPLDKNAFTLSPSLLLASLFSQGSRRTLASPLFALPFPFKEMAEAAVLAAVAAVVHELDVEQWFVLSEREVRDEV